MSSSTAERRMHFLLFYSIVGENQSFDLLLEKLIGHGRKPERLWMKLSALSIKPKSLISLFTFPNQSEQVVAVTFPSIELTNDTNESSSSSLEVCVNRLGVRCLSGSFCLVIFIMETNHIVSCQEIDYLLELERAFEFKQCCCSSSAHSPRHLQTQENNLGTVSPSCGKKFCSDLLWSEASIFVAAISSSKEKAGGDFCCSPDQKFRIRTIFFA